MIALPRNPDTIENTTFTPTSIPGPYRITSIDLLRGIVMIIMALDHTRDYFHADAFFFDPTDMTKTNAPVFFTRWITHFCAPAFVFLSGTSAFLSAQKKTKKNQAWFLFTRGLWLIFLELTVINFGWMFDVNFTHLDFFVFWALGGSMIVLAALIFLPFRAILIIGLVLVFCHNLLDNIHVPGDDLEAFAWGLLHDPREFSFLGRNSFTGYPIIPWVGLMALGYCMGALYSRTFPPVKRKQTLLVLGLVTIFLFVVIRLINVYGDPRPWSAQSSPAFTIMSFLNVTKYPPSLLFILMTIGPALLFLAFSEKPLNRFTRILSTFGRVPLFYYLLHLYLIHLLGMLAAELTGYDWRDMVLTIWVTDSPALDGYGFSLPIVYLIWIGIILVLYPLCKWYDKYKTTHKGKWWLSYL